MSQDLRSGPEPGTELQQDFSDDGATATAWSRAVEQLRVAEVFWLSTVRPDGRPHVTPVLVLWIDDALWFCTGRGEVKAANLAANAHCVLTTGSNSFTSGLDLVLEGDAVRVTDAHRLQPVAEGYAAKYDWQFVVGDGGLVFRDAPQDDPALVFAVEPVKAFGYGRDGGHSATCWRFARRARPDLPRYVH